MFAPNEYARVRTLWDKIDAQVDALPHQVLLMAILRQQEQLASLHKELNLRPPAKLFALQEPQPEADEVQDEAAITRSQRALTFVRDLQQITEAMGRGELSLNEVLGRVQEAASKACMLEVGDIDPLPGQPLPSLEDFDASLPEARELAVGDEVQLVRLGDYYRVCDIREDKVFYKTPLGVKSWTYRGAIEVWRRTRKENV